MTKQPEALRLADISKNGSWIVSTNAWREEAEIELRRLHEINSELLEALKVLVANGGIGSEDMFDDARAAIAKATGEQA